MTGDEKAKVAAGAKIIGDIFDRIFPYKVRLNNASSSEECLEWLAVKMPPHTPEAPCVSHTWIGQRMVGFRDPKLAMEFKLLFG